MKYLPFANNDKMPALGLGTYKSASNEVFEAVLKALDLGYRHFDCASIYGNEAEIGKALKHAFSKGIVERKDLWITSKLWCSEMMPDDVAPALQKTLNELQLDYLDLYLIHWPVPIKKGISYPETAEDFILPHKLTYLETWETLEKIFDSGKIKHLGVSNFNIEKLDTLLRNATLKPEVNQIEMHPFLAQNKMLEYCALHKIHLTAYAPLGTGVGSMRDVKDKKPSLLNNSLIKLIAKDHSASPAQVLLAWAMQRGTSVIPKSVNPKRIAENFKAMQIFLKPVEMEQINELDFDYRYISGDIWTFEGSPYSLKNLWG